jgi:glutamyl-tRNA(Gln) amidotransferase subunit E
MYPETDIPTIKVTKDELTFAKSRIPKPWDESLLEIQNKYKINAQLSEQIFDSEYFDLFEKICHGEKNSPNFVASVLCSTITNLQRNGFDSKLLKHDEISTTFELLQSKKITKESVEIIFQQIMSGKATTALDAVEKASITQLSQDELEKILDKIIEQNYDEIKKDGMRSMSSIMGMVMKQVRGKTSGSLVNQLLKTKIQAIIK